MIYIIGPLLTVILMFALIKSEERAMERERRYWTTNHQAMVEMQWGWSY
jgi:hypothetical protein